MTIDSSSPVSAGVSPASSGSLLDSVKSRYSEGARDVVPELCCPVDYDASLLEVLPQEIIDRDYGCGDPSRFVRPDDVVLDLGSGGGKICYMASQIVGAGGRVIGVDTTTDMLELARKHRQEVGDRIGWHNVDFRRGHIQNLRLDHDALGAWLEAHPVRDVAGYEALERERARLELEAPMIPDESVDVVLSNCVLNLVDPAEKPKMFAEIHRVLKRGGRAAISDIVCDEDVPQELQDNPELWSGCISGAMREDRFLQAFADAGLYGVEIAVYQSEPWAIVQGIEFRSMTVTAHKGKEGPCYDHGEAVIYRGPWKSVVDDDGHTLHRGQRTAVCRKTLGLYESAPYADDVIAVRPLQEISAENAPLFDCSRDSLRAPAETKFGAARADVAPGTSCCDPAGGADGASCC
ncbi:arsenite S-adenosylmethyltransferase [Planctomycetes bacterium Poly30]|uniref:Arsenite methyltransferase n=1 Tax=Saltatorellus ferox TaxID=2528018 RepID=A0A518EX74_9BACT|nr:arsenite S-adenosylmethyltransferase [Planctomycetes bacterium Poly30]